MSRHNYTNPAFCQKSEFYQTSTPTQNTLNNHHQQQQQKQLCFDTSSVSINGLGNEGVGVRRIQRSVSTRSFRTNNNSNNNNGNKNQRGNVLNRSQHQHYIEENKKLPIPGPKPYLNNTIGSFEPTTQISSVTSSLAQRSGSGRYALVPVEELSNVNKNGRYAIIPGPTNENNLNNSIKNTTNNTNNISLQRKPIQRYTKSQDNIDRYSHVPVKEEPSSYHDEINDTFTSLPPISNNNHDQPKLKAAFSSDFGSNSFVLVDQKNNQRYSVVPTADDEDIVDDNHEIIQMLNGRAHRYAVIPTEDEEDPDEEEETCLSTSDLNQSYSIIQDINRQQPLHSSTPQKNLVKLQQQPQQLNIQQQHQSYPCTPIKNPAATRKLHELLSTPRKTPTNQRNSRTPTRTNKLGTQRHYQSQQQIYVSQQSIRQELSPQRLQYESTKQSAANDAYLEARTTAVITPRVANQLDNGDCSYSKSWNGDESYPQKVANATATLGVISLMLILGSLMNSGLCLYLIANAGRSFYLEFGLASAFAGVGLGILGFRSRHCEWLPNRSYISGYILVTVFCLLKCCGLLVLLALNPYPGMPLHDVTTGIILGLSTFTIFFIGLGVLGSRWCYRPPQDNRVNVY